MGSEVINLGLKDIWKAWSKFRKGKRMSMEMHEFQYHLHKNLNQLYRDLNSRAYRHGPYKKFTVCDNKRREISVSSVRDRVVHRLLYDYLVPLFDPTFVYDAWSCRKGKGLIGAIQRTQSFLNSYPDAYVWRADIKKFFDSVNHEILANLILKRANSSTTNWLISLVIRSYSTCSGTGIPIGNLTSQIFANIYLNELDHFVKHTLKPKAYLRYGDDFVIFVDSKEQIIEVRLKVIAFLQRALKLELHPTNDHIIQARQGLKFLGCWIYPMGRKLTNRNWVRVKERVNLRNISSYHGLVSHHSTKKKQKEFRWRLLEDISSIQ